MKVGDLVKVKKPPFIAGNEEGREREGQHGVIIDALMMNDGFYEFELKPWDICAGSLIVSESGGIVSDWDGKELPKSGKRILAGNKHIHKKMQSILSKKKYSLFF